jgi:hypothetical protein
MVKIAVDFHERLRFPRGDCGASSAAPAGSPQTATSRWSLRLSLQSTARICMIQYEFFYNQKQQFMPKQPYYKKEISPWDRRRFVLHWLSSKKLS